MQLIFLVSKYIVVFDGQILAFKVSIRTSDFSYAASDAREMYAYGKYVEEMRK